MVGKSRIGMVPALFEKHIVGLSSSLKIFNAFAEIKVLSDRLMAQRPKVRAKTITAENGCEHIGVRVRANPLFSDTASVYAPFVWPKNSSSKIVFVNEAIFTAKNGASRRLLKSWMVRASSSLPVPDSP